MENLEPLKSDLEKANPVLYTNLIKIYSPMNIATTEKSVNTMPSEFKTAGDIARRKLNSDIYVGLRKISAPKTLRNRGRSL